MEREEVLEFLNDKLDLEHFKKVEDAKFNGALVKGTEEVERIGLCTNTTFENIESAAENGLDMVISHHGGWKKFDQDLLEKKKQRIREADLTWYIAHETLDCAEFGVSATLAEKLGINVQSQYAEEAGGKVGVYGNLEVSEKEFLERLENLEPGYSVVGEIESPEEKRIGVIGGGGGAYPPLIQNTAEKNCEILIVGSCSFYGKIYAYEKDVTMIVMTETSSEKWGVYSLGEKLKQEFPGLKLHKIEEKNW